MADIDLPVFSFVPNWRNGVVEFLEFLTDVLRSKISGHEQRRSIRITPRRMFEATFNPLHEERAFMDLWLHRFGAQEALLPLWHDQARLDSAADSSTLRLDFDNTYREFETGGLALVRSGTFDFEVVEIADQDDEGLDLSAGLTRSWPLGTTVFPLRPAEIEDSQGTLGAITSVVGQSSLRFRLTRSNPYPLGDEVLPLYEGYPVVSLEPNRADDLEVRYEQLFEEADFDIGLTYRRNETDRSFPAQFYNWQARNRQQRHELRQALYRMNGRQKAVWMPSFNADITLAGNVSPSSTSMDIKKIGYNLFGGPVSGRDHILLKDNSGTNRVVQVAGTGSPPDPDTQERLSLIGSAGFSASEGRVGSFLDLVRMDQDVVEITHHTDSVCEAAAAFKSFTNGRDPGGTLVLPYAVAAKSVQSCGLPAEAEKSPCMGPVFQGWYAKLRVSWINPSTASPGNGYRARPTGAQEINHSSGGSSNYRTVVPFQYIEMTWTSPQIEESSFLSLRMQFPFRSVANDMRATATFQRWNGGSTQLIPLPGSDTLGAIFDVFALWPGDWYFNI